MCSAFITKGNGLAKIGRRREALALMELAVKVAAERGLTDYQLRAAGNLGIAIADDDFKASIDYMSESLALARRIGQRALLLNGIGNYAYQAYAAGEWDSALALTAEALAEDVSPRNRLFILNNEMIIRASRGERETVEAGLAEMERLGRDMAEEWRSFLADPMANAEMAWGDLRRAYAQFITLPEADFSQAPEYFYRCARISLWLGDVADASNLLERFDQSGALGMAAVDARGATMRAGMAAAEGRTTEALALYRDALRRWRDVHGPWDEALTGLDMAILLDPAEPEVAAAIANSRSIMERLGAKPYLEKLDAAVARFGGPTKTPAARSTAAAQAEVTAS
jgi:tetratricopeptide (TPR) repeat protein